MSGLRDARLRKALECAPDEGELPLAGTRRAIKAHAHEAVKARARARWWKKLYASTGGSQRMPWNAALATVAVATLVTLLWHDGDPLSLPPPSGEGRGGGDATPQAPQRPHPNLPPEGEGVRPTAPAPPARTKSADTDVAKAERSARESRELADSRESPALSQARREAAGELTKQQAAVADAGPVPAPPVAQSAPAGAPAAVPGPAPAAAPAPAPRLRMQFQPSEGATTLRVALAGRSHEAPLARPSPLSDLLDRASREATGTDPLQAPVELSLDLEREGVRLGLLEIAGAQLRWTPVNGQPRTGTPDPAFLQALRAEIGKLPR